MKEKAVSAFDGTTEFIVPVKVITDADEAPAVLFRDEPLTDEAAGSLTAYERKILSLMLEDFRECPTFDGERIYSARGHFYVSKPARRMDAAPED